MNLHDKAQFIADDVIRVCVKNGAGHIAPSLSSVDLLVALYYDAMKEGDKLIFSKAHGAYALYAILKDIGKIKEEDWENFYKGSFLSGCIERSPEHGIEAGTGALGHGLPMAVGMAFANKILGKPEHTYCIVGDGELQEGSNWEAMGFAATHKLDNLTLIVDNNKLQAMDFTDKVITTPFHENGLMTKIIVFGFDVHDCDGHDLNQIVHLLNNKRKIAPETRKPQCLFANTIKGYRLKCAENVPKFHFRVPTEEELKT